MMMMMMMMNTHLSGPPSVHIRIGMACIYIGQAVHDVRGAGPQGGLPRHRLPMRHGLQGAGTHTLASTKKGRQSRGRSADNSRGDNAQAVAENESEPSCGRALGGLSLVAGAGLTIIETHICRDSPGR
jgi:hypothetical protein